MGQRYRIAAFDGCTHAAARRFQRRHARGSGRDAVARALHHHVRIPSGWTEVRPVAAERGVLQPVVAGDAAVEVLHVTRDLAQRDIDTSGIAAAVVLAAIQLDTSLQGKRVGPVARTLIAIDAVRTAIARFMLRDHACPGGLAMRIVGRQVLAALLQVVHQGLPVGQRHRRHRGVQRYLLAIERDGFLCGRRA